jgi:hypothetical protein
MKGSDEKLSEPPWIYFSTIGNGKKREKYFFFYKGGRFFLSSPQLRINKAFSPVLTHPGFLSYLELVRKPPKERKSRPAFKCKKEKSIKKKQIASIFKCEASCKVNQVQFVCPSGSNG